MKKLLYSLPLIAFIFLSSSVFSQENLLYKSVQDAKTLELDFQAIPSAFSQAPEIREILDHFESLGEVDFFHYDKNIYDGLSEAVSLNLPLKTGQLQLELLEVPASFYNYEIVTSDGKRLSASKGIKHYRGIVKDDRNSLVAISFMENEVIGLIAKDEGNFNLIFDEKSGVHVFYNDKNLKRKMEFWCENHNHNHDFKQYDPEVLSQTSKSSISSEDVCIRLYLETEHDIFQTRGSVASVESFVTSVFNQMATLYQNEGVGTSISEIFVWTTPDPYTATHPFTLLQQFQSHRTAFNGDLAQLLTFRGTGIAGWAAGFNGLCNSDVSERLSVSMLENSYQTVPSYSGSVFIMAHEFGHLFGSYHTHACAWNGDNTAIDGCQSTEDVGFGFCSLPGIPPEGGTIMSYCTNQSVGVNFNLGFGPQPGNVIRSSVANAACLCECVNSTISGPDYLCSTNTFTLQNVPVGSTVSWSVSPTHLFSGSTSGNGTNASLSPASWDSSGQATLTFSIEGDCGTVESSTEFWVGRAVSNIEGPYEMAVNTVENYFATGNPYMGITDYQWSVFPSGYHWIGNQGTNGITLSFSATGLYSLELDVVNPCGARGSEIGIYVYNPWEHFNLYPNPTSDILHISLDLEARGRGGDQDFEVSLYDGQGRELIPTKPAHQEASLDLSRIPKGFYYVHIRYRDALLRRQIRVER